MDCKEKQQYENLYKNGMHTRCIPFFILYFFVPPNHALGAALRFLYLG